MLVEISSICLTVLTPMQLTVVSSRLLVQRTLVTHAANILVVNNLTAGIAEL